MDDIYPTPVVNKKTPKHKINFVGVKILCVCTVSKKISHVIII